MKDTIYKEITEHGWSVDKIVKTRPSRLRSGHFVYYTTRHGNKEVSFISDEDFREDLDDTITAMSYEQENTILAGIPL